VRVVSIDSAHSDRRTGEAARSIATVTARRINRQQFVEVEFGDRLQLLGRDGTFEALRQSVEPGAIFVLQ